MLAPIVEVSIPDEDTPRDLNPILFVRRQLILQVALAVTRMHDNPGDGKTGMTASIEALLDAAGRLTVAHVSSFKAELAELRRRYQLGGGDPEELRRFRHAELAHSLQRHNEPEAPLLLRPLWDFAHDTFELVSSMERWLDDSGMDFMFLSNRFECWHDQGFKFWKATGLLKE